MAENAATLMIKALEAEGVRRIYGVPGEENLDLLEALRQSAIELVITRHEQAAGFMAAIEGRLTGKAGVCLATLGPGATNLVTAAAYAQLGAMPMLMITGQKPVRASRQAHFQRVDVVGNDAAANQVHLPDRRRRRHTGRGPGGVPAGADGASRRGAPELPEDIARDASQALPLAASRSRRPVAEDKAIAAAVQAIADSRRPLLMIGAGANRKTTCRMLSAFVEEIGIPFFTTQQGKGVVDESHPLWLGNAALSEGDFVHRAIDQSDCILNIGHDVVEKPPFFMRDGRRTVIHVNFSGADVDPVYFPQIEVVGDIAHSVWRLGMSFGRRRPGIFPASTASAPPSTGTCCSMSATSSGRCTRRGWWIRCAGRCPPTAW